MAENPRSNKDEDQEGILKNWHFRREFHAGHIFTTVLMIAALVGVYADSREQSARFAAEIAQNQQSITIIQESQRLDQTPERLARIEVSIERLTVTMERVLDRMDRQAAREEPPRREE